MHFFNAADIADAISNWGYLGIFICVFIGNLGFPVPEETVVLVAGFLAGHEILEVKTVYAVAVASAIAGDSCGYFIGRTGGQRLLERLSSHFEFAHRRYEKLKVFFKDHGSKAVFLARFVTGVRFMAGPMAGAAGMHFWQFLGWNILGALVWCFLMVAIGYLVVDELWGVIHVTHRAVQLAGLIAIVLAVIGYLFWQRRRRNRTT